MKKSSLYDMIQVALQLFSFKNVFRNTIISFLQRICPIIVMRKNNEIFTPEILF